jgi:GDP-4-dehydro-6-deoxy-D-mannose reductase
MGNILLTGVNGFVGRHLAREFAEHGFVVSGVGGQLPNESPVEHVNEYQVLDLNDAAAARKIDFSTIDGVIHLAGLAAVGPSFDEPMQYLTTNLGIEVNLFEAALAQGAKPRFVIVSSGTLYDPSADVPLTETSRVLPNSPYAISKLGQEQLAEYYISRGFECIIARPFNHIGPGQGLGFIVPDLTKQIIEVEKGLSKEVLVGNLDAQRDYTDVRDIARAYRLLLEKGKSAEIYNICSGTARSGHEILDGITKTARQQPKVTVDPIRMRPSDNPLIYGSHEKLTEHTGWEPEISLEMTLHDVVVDWRSRI